MAEREKGEGLVLPPPSTNLASGRRYARRRSHRQHDPETNRHDRPDAEPDSGNLLEDTGLPQREHGADQKQRVTDEVKGEELHGTAAKHEGCRLGRDMERERLRSVPTA